jgi:23S rRNA-/tRNA-specific pseudouridylate synthase
MSTPKARWMVSRDDPKRLSDLVEQIALDGRRALADGRVFVDGRRVTDPETTLRAGHRVELFAARQIEHEVEVLLTMGGIVAANKPVGIATEPEQRGTDSVRSRVARLIGEPEERLHATSRLDLGVSGVVLFALTSEARRELESARVEARLHKRYVAIASSRPPAADGIWNQPLKLRPRGGEVEPVKDPHAVTAFRVVTCLAASTVTARPASRASDAAHWTLLALEPITGRTHQLRIHAAQAGAPLLGDGRYGGVPRIVDGDGSIEAISRVALHAASVEFVARAGSGGASWVVHAPEPADLVSLWVRLGGTADDWIHAAEDPLHPA